MRRLILLTITFAIGFVYVLYSGINSGLFGLIIGVLCVVVPETIDIVADVRWRRKK